MDLTKYSRQLELENSQREEGINRYIFNTSKANESGRASMTGPELSSFVSSQTPSQRKLKGSSKGAPIDQLL